MRIRVPLVTETYHFECVPMPLPAAVADAGESAVTNERMAVWYVKCDDLQTAKQFIRILQAKTMENHMKSAYQLFDS